MHSLTYLFTVNYKPSCSTEMGIANLLTTPSISFSPHRFHEFPFCSRNSLCPWYRGDYVGLRIEANWNCREAVDYDDYDEHYVH